MKTLLFILISSGVCFSQKAKENYIIYYNYANEGEFYFYENEYDSAVIYFEHAFKFASEPSPYHQEKYARALWKLDNRKKAIEELQQNYHYRGVDTNWYTGLSQKEIDKINTTRMKIWNNYSEERKLYHSFVDSLANIDQYFRNTYYNDTTTRHLIWEQDDLNGIALIEFTIKHGFPGGKNYWGHNLSAMILHMSPEWFIENYALLISEVHKGNLEPWMLAQGIDRMFTVEVDDEKINPYNRYWRKSKINPFLMFQNCIAIGVSPYYHFNWRTSRPEQTIHFDYYKENKKNYNTTFMYIHNIK